jgi:hypothetical protein
MTPAERVAYHLTRALYLTSCVAFAMAARTLRKARR